MWRRRRRTGTVCPTTGHGKSTFSLTPALDEDGWLMPHPSHLTLEKEI
jgi:hypothetical protein